MNLNIVWVSIAILFDEGDRYIPEELLMYKINYIVDKVKYLISEYKTGDPFELCDAMGIHIYYKDLGDRIKAFYFYQSRIKNIVINIRENEKIAKLLCSHELGHCVLHGKPTDSRAFCDMKIFDYASMAECEANLFAAELMIDDSVIMEILKNGGSVFDAAKILEVPAGIVDFKLRILKNKGYDVKLPNLVNSEFLRNI